MEMNGGDRGCDTNYPLAIILDHSVAYDRIRCRISYENKYGERELLENLASELFGL